MQTWRLENLEKLCASQTLGLTPKWTKHVGMSSDVTGYEAWTSLPFVTLENIRQLPTTGKCKRRQSTLECLNSQHANKHGEFFKPFESKKAGENQNSAKCARKWFGIHQMFWTRFGTWAPQKYRTVPTHLSTIPTPTMSTFIPMPISIYRGVTSCVTIAKNMGKVWYFSNLNWSHSKHTNIYHIIIHLRWGWGWLACPQQQTQEYVPMLKCVYVCVAIGSCCPQSADCRKVKNNIR